MDTETPVMAQYAAAKRRFPDALLFFRMGDFFELFHDDAKVASQALGLTLTARDREKKIPMAGVPVRAVEGYLRRLVRQGHKVALCDQMEDPATAKGLVDRAVVRLVTAGTLTEDAALDPGASNYLLAIRPGKRRAGLAWVDLSTGRFLVADVAPEAVLDETARVAPAEVLLPEGDDGDALARQVEAATGLVATRVAGFTFAADAAARTLKDHFRVGSLTAFTLDREPPSLGAAGAALEYLRQTQMTALAHVVRIERHDPGQVLLLDRTSRRRLDLVEREGGEREGTLLGVLDATKTAMGGRALREWILSPLRDAAAISRRHDGVEELVKDAFLRRDLAAALGAVRDIERILARVATNRANARDLAALGDSLAPLPELRRMLGLAYSATLAGLKDRVDPFDDLRELLARAVADDAPPTIKEGGLFRAGYHAELDELRGLSRTGKDWIAAYQATEAERSGIPTLKVGFNRVFGYYIEVTKQHLAKVPPEYVRRQTVANGERFVTETLRTYEDKVLGADERAKDLELKLFQALRETVAARIPALQALAATLAELDVLQSLAEVASAGGWVRPELLDDRTLELVEGRHPVVERHLPPGERFVPNDVVLDGEKRIALITGPNMAGKSTYIRQAARARAPGADGVVRPVRAGARGPVRPHLHARRRRGRPRGRPVHVHGRDERGGAHPAARDRPQPRRARRDRPRHEHVRRHRARLGHHRVPLGGRGRTDALRDALPRAHRDRGPAHVGQEPQRGGARVGRRDRLRAAHPGGRDGPLVRHPRRAARGRAGGRRRAGEGGPRGHGGQAPRPRPRREVRRRRRRPARPRRPDPPLLARPRPRGGGAAQGGRRTSHAHRGPQHASRGSAASWGAARP